MFRKQFFRGAFWLKGRYILASFMILLILLVVTQVFIPTGDGQENNVGDRAYWQSLANGAWQYYQPGAGVNVQTGLHGAGLGWPYFTEWDLGTYIQAIIDARQLGILQEDGSWGFDYRIEKVLNFLQTRKLTIDNVPFSVYDARTGEPSSDTPTFSIDEGKLYMALYNLKLLKPDLAQNIDNIVKVRHSTINIGLIPDPNSWLEPIDVYCYYVANAFKAFGFPGWDEAPSLIIDAIVSQRNVTTNGVKLPVAHICNEPLLLTFFEINPQDPKFTWLLSQVNLAQEARYMATGNYTAFSEGNTGLDDPSYVYEFVVERDGTTWKIDPKITPIAYFKIAVGQLAIFNTTYNQNMVNYIKTRLPTPSTGFQEGVAEDGRIVGNIIDRTNGLILSAARYAISQIPVFSPTSTPTAIIISPTSTPTAIIISPTPTLTPTETHSPSPSPSLSPISSSTPTVSPISSHSFSSSPFPSSSLSPSSSPSKIPASSPTSSSSLFYSASPFDNSIPTANTNAPLSTEIVVIVVSVVVSCSLLVSLLLIRSRAHSSTKHTKKYMPTKDT